MEIDEVPPVGNRIPGAPAVQDQIPRAGHFPALGLPLPLHSARKLQRLIRRAVAPPVGLALPAGETRASLLKT